MCGRYTIRRIDQFIRHGAMEPALFDVFDEKRIVPNFSSSFLNTFTPRFNIAPTHHLPIMCMRNNSAVLELARWGFIPAWTREAPKIQPINARSETVATSGMFKRSFNQRRCLVPADGFYEWQGTKPPKTPYFIYLKEHRPFMFAGLWDRWTPPDVPDAEPIDTFTILTTTANALMKPIHQRMPVILSAEDYTRWLDPALSGQDVMDLLRPFDAAQMEAYAISNRVNSVRNDGPELIERVCENDGQLWN